MRTLTNNRILLSTKDYGIIPVLTGKDIDQDNIVELIDKIHVENDDANYNIYHMYSGLIVASKILK